MTRYKFNGNPLAQSYDFFGKTINGDYDIADTDYQRAILSARNAWMDEVRNDNSVIPLIITTDQHRHFYASNKPTFEYLGKAISWGEVSAMVNLGDTCGAVYNTTDLNAMLTSMAYIPKDKQLHIMGNHDVAAGKTEGSSYAYSIITDDLWDVVTKNYFDNRNYNGHRTYDNRGNEVAYDAQRKVKYCMMADWYYGTAPNGEKNQPYHTLIPTGEVIEYWIDMLSEVSDYDIVILSHIQPLYDTHLWHRPEVESPAFDEEKQRNGGNCLAYSVGLDSMIADRKNKTAGTIIDHDGVAHNYDFSRCTSDILCTLSGHLHGDRYTVVNGVPVCIFDAYGYDNEPLFMVNIDRTQKRLNVWKFDEAANVYNFQIPFAG